MSPDPDLNLLRPPLNSGVPLPALAVYARWWQLETYLREVVYTELRAAFGVGWINELDGTVPDRAERDRINSYMASADADDVLSYADASVLFELIAKHWGLFEPILLPRQRWEGLAETLTAIRHRSAHCRRPHRDDLSRLEQALRDLESGARTFYGSYGDVRYVRDGKDPLVKAWVKENHPDAARLIKHCKDQYDVTFRLGYCTRPWAVRPASDSEISGTKGVLWRAQWIFGGNSLDPEKLWGRLEPGVRELIVHCLLDEFSVEATFAAVDPVDQIADAIGRIFDSAIEASRSPGRRLGPSDGPPSADGLPPKAQVNTALALFDPYNPEAFSLFSAH